MILAGLVAGFAIATWLPGRERPAPASGVRDAATAPARPAASAPTAGRDAALASRLAEVEAALAAELDEHAMLEARLDALAAELAAFRAAAGVPGAAPQQASAPPPAVRGPRERPGEASQRDLTERLVAGGFTTDRAAYIAARVEQLPMEALRAQYEARRNGTPAGEAVLSFERALRAELGDVEYERYLAALGRPTSVPVSNVLASSPAEQAGLRDGDRIVAYGGERVFTPRDLDRLTFEGTPGEPVLVDVLRDGQTFQVVIPRGPLGVTSGRFRRR